MSEQHDNDPLILNSEETDAGEEGIEEENTEEDSAEDEKPAEQRQVSAQLIADSRDANTQMAHSIRSRIEGQINMLHDLAAEQIVFVNRENVEANIRRRANLIYISALHFNRAKHEHNAKESIAGDVKDNLKKAEKDIIKAEGASDSGKVSAAKVTNAMIEIPFKVIAFLEDACGITGKRNKSEKQESDTKEREPGRGPLVGDFPKK